MKDWLVRLGLLLSGLYAFYYFAFPVYTHRFRLTFQVEVNGKVKEGSGVITVAIQDNQMVPLNQSRWNLTRRGPSPWIDLGQRGILLAAIEPHIFSYKPNPYDVGELSFVVYFGAEHGRPEISRENVRNIANQKGKRQLKDNQLPEFIWLPDPHNPKSAQIVPPSRFGDVIGQDVSLGAVFVEITRDHSNASLYEKLPWLQTMEKKEKASGMIYRPAEFQLSAHVLLGDL